MKGVLGFVKEKKGCNDLRFVAYVREKKTLEINVGGIRALQDIQKERICI